jgi:stage IV sporulation protein FB
MTWQDRQYASDEPRGSAWGRPGGDWAGMRPTIDNPFTWSLPIARVGGITVRMHLFFLAYILIELGRGLVPAKGQHIDFELTALAMGVLVTIVLVHELGHCLACRLVRGQADEILMWPLGGLAFCHPPQYWRAHFVTAAGGPLVNVLICALAGSMLGLLTGQWGGVAIPNILDPFARLADPAISRSWAHIALYMFNVISLVLLAFNLLPMFPMDGGRLLQALLWPRYGWSRSMRFAVRLGYVTGMALAVFGAMTSNWSLIAIAIFGLWSCYVTHKQLEFSDSMLGLESDEEAMDAYGGTDEPEPSTAGGLPTQTQRATQRQAPSRVQEAQEVDRILQKIARNGLDSLSGAERGLLQRATERRRAGEP